MYQLASGSAGKESGKAEDEGTEFCFVARGNSRAQCLLYMEGNDVLRLGSRKAYDDSSRPARSAGCIAAVRPDGDRPDFRREWRGVAVRVGIVGARIKVVAGGVECVQVSRRWEMTCL